MVEALLPKCVWLFLLLMISHVSADSFSVVVPKTPVIGMLGASVTLPCTISSNLDATKLEVRWYRPSMYNSPALFYQNGRLVTTTHEEHQGVSLVGPLEKGDVSLKLDNLRLTDKGDYICHVSSDRWYDKKNMSLIIQAMGSSPILSVVDAGEGKVNVSCHSHGWLPKPSLSWKDSAGKSLKHPNQDTSTSVSDGLFSVSSWLLSSPSESSWISCSVALPDSIEEMRESRVIPPVPKVEETWKGAFITTLIVLLLFIIGLAVYCGLLQKGVIGSKENKAKGVIGSKEKKAEEGLALNEGEMKPLLNPPTADTPHQAVGAENHDPDHQTNNITSPPTETQALNEVENQPLQDPQTEDTPQQPVVVAVNHDQEPEPSLSSSPTAGGNYGYQDPQPNPTSSPPADDVPVEGNQNQSSGAKQKSPLPAEGNHEQDSQPYRNSSPSAENQLARHSELSPKKTHTAAEWEQVKKFKVNITIDPAETPDFFRITHKRKRVTCTQTKENHEDEEEKCKIFTLCKEKFSSGQQYWELKLKEYTKKKISWFVGVATDEAEREYRIPLTPENGFWVLCYEEQTGVYIRERQTPTTLPGVSDEIKTVGVFLDCNKHTLSFYNTDTQSLIYTFNNVTFRTSLHPLISPGIRDTIPVHIC